MGAARHGTRLRGPAGRSADRGWPVFFPSPLAVVAQAVEFGKGVAFGPVFGLDSVQKRGIGIGAHGLGRGLGAGGGIQKCTAQVGQLIQGEHAVGPPAGFGRRRADRFGGDRLGGWRRSRLGPFFVLTRHGGSHGGWRFLDRGRGSRDSRRRGVLFQGLAQQPDLRQDFLVGGQDFVLDRQDFEEQRFHDGPP